MAVLAGTVYASASAPPAPQQARISQAGRRLVFSLRTSRPVALAGLRRLPGDKDRYLCIEMRAAGRTGTRAICLGGPGKAKQRAGLLLLNAQNKATGRRTIAARVKRPRPRKLVLSLLPGDAGLLPHRYRWRVFAGGPCAAAATCANAFPPRHSGLFRLRPVRPVGCTGGSAGLDRNGSRDRNVVALTFDDGPSTYTDGFLRVLREKRVRATFFEIGQEMSRYPETMRKILRQGHEIGNHTMHHTELPGYSSIAPASALTESITHFRPCLFRPPGGALNSSVIAAAGADSLRTITWDVDPADWTNPGSGAVYSRVVGATRPGSIVLMHDGGGNRSGTLAALPAIIDTLRSRGYRFTTVTGLLGHRLLYRPYG